MTMASPAVAAPHRNATMSVDINLFGSGGGGICSVHYGDAQSMGDGTPKSPKRKADFNQSNAEEEEEDYCSSSFSSCDIDNEDGRKWNVFVGGSSIDESLVQELFGGNRLSMASFCSRPTAPAGPPAVVSPSTSSGSGSCLGGTLHDLISEGCNRLFNDFQSAVASISIPPPSNISTGINSVNLQQQQQQQQQHSTPTSNGAATATPIAIAQPNDHRQQQQAELTSSCTTTSLPSSSSSSCAASICTFNESNSSPDSLVLSVLTEADIARNQKRILEAEQSRVAALEANLRWAETVALWREEMGPRGVILDCELVDRKQQDEDGEDDDDDDISVHEGMVFFCELDGNTDDEEEDEEEEGVDYIDDDDDDFDVEFIYEEEDESDGMSPQQQQQTSQMNAAAATSVENTTFQLNSSSDSCYRYRSIRFSALPPEVHLIEEDEEDEENKSEEDKDEVEKEEEDKCRLPNWTLMALDRMRTQHDMNLLLAPIFAAEHRERIYQQRFAEKAEANGKTDNV